MLMFLLASVLVIALVSSDQYTSTVLPLSFWARARMTGFPYKMTALVLLLATIAACIYHFARKAPDVYVLLIAIALIALQTNGIKVGALNLVSVLPFLVILFLLAESFRNPEFQIVLPGLMFFGILLLLLDIPYLAAPHIYSPPRFLINFFSTLKAVLIAFVFVNLLRTQRHLAFAVRAFLVVAFISALIGVAQLGVHRFTGITLNLVSEMAERKPTSEGMALRATGLTTWASWLSDFLVLALPFLLFRFFNARSLRWRSIYLFAIVVLLVGIYATLTFAAYFAAAAIFMLFPFVYWPRRIVHFLVTILLAAGLFQIAGGFTWTYEHGVAKIQHTSGMVERRVYLQSTLNEIARDPWMGSGFYAEEEFSENFYRKRVHNTGLQAWANLGLAGLLVFLAMMLTILTQLWLMASASRGEDRQLFQALGLGVVASIVEMFAEPNLTVAVTWFHLGLCQAALIVHCTWRYPRPFAPAAGAAPGPA
jgi:O-antigen ligase